MKRKSDLKRILCLKLKKLLLRKLFLDNGIDLEKLDAILEFYCDGAYVAVTGINYNACFDGLLTFEENDALVNGIPCPEKRCLAAIYDELKRRSQNTGDVWHENATIKKYVTVLCNEKNDLTWKKVYKNALELGLKEGIICPLNLMNIPSSSATGQVVSMSRLFRASDFITHDELTCFRDMVTSSMKQPIALFENFEYEYSIATTLFGRMKGNEPILSSDEMTKLLPVLNSSNLSDEQKQAVIVSLRNPVSIITGGPGRGKTTVLKTICELIERVNEDVEIRLSAFTGRAAKNMGLATERESYTLHRLVGIKEDGDTGRKFDADIIIIDEATMLDMQLFDTVLANADSDSRMVLVGDIDQLPSIGVGMIFRDLIDSGVIPVARLNKCFRQEEDSDIIVLADTLNAKVNCGFFEKKLPQSSTVTLYDENSVMTSRLEHSVEKLLKSCTPDEIQVLTPRNEPKSDYNKCLRRLLNPTPNGDDDAAFWVNDRVINTKNDYNFNVCNGEIGRVVCVENGVIKVEFSDNCVPSGAKYVPYNEVPVDENERSIELAYAITVHKAQGSEFPAVVVVLKSDWVEYMSTNLLYTAVTRAKKQLVLISTKGAVETVIGHPVNRKTFLMKWMQVLNELDRKKKTAIVVNQKPLVTVAVAVQQDEIDEQLSFL